LRQLLSQGQGGIQRGLREAFVIDGGGEIRARGERSYLFDFERPAMRRWRSRKAGELVLIEDWAQNEFRALIRLRPSPTATSMSAARWTARSSRCSMRRSRPCSFYRQLELDRGRVLFEFGLLYLGFAMIMILAAIWLGLWFAERLSRPVGRLTSAAQRVGQGDLDVRVAEEQSDDEIAMLGQLFNQMTRQLKGQRDTLIEQNAATEARRRLFDSAC
jgi:two-component system nitrogen regulation sensor histidine kinase NtrY